MIRHLNIIKAIEHLAEKLDMMAEGAGFEPAVGY